jgi:hypothetical protein
MANFSTQRTIHESQSFEIVPAKSHMQSHTNEIAPLRVQHTTGREPTGILAFFATLPHGQRRANFTMPRQEG